MTFLPKPLRVTCTLLVIALIPATQAATLDTNRIDQITGLKGLWNTAEGVFKVSSPRSDVVVKVDEWKMPPFMGLTSWAGFLAGKKSDAMVMGDFVLFEDEVNLVMSAAIGSGLEVTALHNHFFHAEPPVYFMHIGGEGTVEKLAGGVKAVLAAVKDIRTAQPEPAKSFGGGIPEKNAISPAPLAELFSAKPQEKDGMVKFVFGRVARMECGCEVGKEMGVNTWASFGGTDDNAVVDGDFASREDELQGVLKDLRGAGINIVAIHHHMIGESPRYVFLHYWGRGKAADLARALQTARSEQAKAPVSVEGTSAHAHAIHFDDATPGAVPPGWTATKTGSGSPKWLVVPDDTAPSKPNVLKQSGEATYPIALKDDTNLKDGFVEVKFKPVSGKEDQAGGVIWRAKDADNYYIARANALEDNVTIYHTLKGKRVSFKNVNMPVKSGEWHTLRVDFTGDKFIVTFDGKQVIETTNDSLADAGKVGVWTKADSVTLFDDFSYGTK